MQPVRRMIWICLLLAGCNRSASLDIYDPATHGVHSLSAGMEGHILVLNFWAPWCKPCREEIPQLNHFATTHVSSATVLAVNFDHPQGKALGDAADAAGIRYPSLVTDPAMRFTLPEISGLPTTIVLDGQGSVLKVLPGPQTEESLSNALKP